jgi:hypothetical protein
LSSGIGLLFLIVRKSGNNCLPLSFSPGGFKVRSAILSGHLTARKNRINISLFFFRQGKIDEMADLVLFLLDFEREATSVLHG